MDIVCVFCFEYLRGHFLCLGADFCHCPHVWCADLEDLMRPAVGRTNASMIEVDLAKGVTLMPTQPLIAQVL